MDKMESCIYPW